MGQLANNQAFEVHLWQDGADDHSTAAEAEAQSAGGDRWQQRIDVSQTTAVRAAGAGAVSVDCGRRGHQSLRGDWR